MSRPFKKYSQTPIANTATSNDYIVIVKAGSGNTFTTERILAPKLNIGLLNGPYANDTVANTNGVDVGQLYYTSNGDVKIRLT